MRISFTVPAIPVAQPRQRMAVIAGHAHNYTPTKHPVNAFKAAVAMAFNENFGGTGPLLGPIKFHAQFVMPRPKSVRKKEGAFRIYRERGRGDWDNLAKSVTDALKGLAWKDDSQIACAIVQVFLACVDEQPHCEIAIEEIER